MVRRQGRVGRGSLRCADLWQSGGDCGISLDWALGAGACGAAQAGGSGRAGDRATGAGVTAAIRTWDQRLRRDNPAVPDAAIRPRAGSGRRR